jgi:hypothetical protein
VNGDSGVAQSNDIERHENKIPQVCVCGQWWGW